MKVALAAASRDVVVEVSGALRRGSSVVDIASDRNEMLSLVTAYSYDAVVVGSDLDRIGGIQTVQDIRRRNQRVPIVVYGPDDAAGRTACFVQGADDVMPRATGSEEFLARLRALIRRSNGYGQSEIAVGNVSVDLDAHAATVAGRALAVTAKEYALLELFFLRKGCILGKQQLLDHLYTGMDEPDDRIIGVFLCTLRKKLRDLGADIDIETVRGLGYVLRTASAERVIAAERAVA